MSTQKLIRNVLRGTDGLTSRKIAEKINKDANQVRESLRVMPDVYIDRWEPCPGPHKYAAVFVAVDVPEDCPKPE